MNTKLEILSRNDYENLHPSYFSASNKRFSNAKNQLWAYKIGNIIYFIDSTKCSWDNSPRKYTINQMIPQEPCKESCRHCSKPGYAIEHVGEFEQFKTLSAAKSFLKKLLQYKYV